MLLDEQVHVANVIRSVDERAPAHLRAQIADLRAERAPAMRRRRFVLVAEAAAAMAAVAVIALALSSGGPGAPTVAQAAALGTRPAAFSAPPVEASQPTLLAESAAGQPDPNWRGKFGWRASGRRVDRIDGRRAETVFYAKNRYRIGYTIVSGEKLAWPAGVTRSVREGTLLRDKVSGGRRVVTWLRGGHTCVLSGPAEVKRDVMLNLAAWKGKGSVPF